MALVHQLSDGFTSQVYRCCSDEIGVKEIVCNRVRSFTGDVWKPEDSLYGVQRSWQMET